MSARRRRFCPVPKPENEGAVAKPAESSAIGNKPELPPFMRGKGESSAKEGLGVLAPALPRLTNQPSPYGWNKGSRGCRSEVGATPSRRVNVARRGKSRGVRCAKGSIARGMSSRHGSGVTKIVVSRRGNARRRDAGFGRSRGRIRATGKTPFAQSFSAASGSEIT